MTTSVADTTIDAAGLRYQELNRRVRDAAAGSSRRIALHNVFGQRYIGTNLRLPAHIDVHGTPGNDLGAFMDGPTITVYGNAQDGCGNTMNDGLIVVHGRAGDITGLAARGGKVFIRDDVGYRAGIHMKEYGDRRPALVIGGTAQDFLGEYMAGGVIVLLGLGLSEGERHAARLIGTGMHGGVIFIRGDVDPHQLAASAAPGPLDRSDHALLSKLVGDFGRLFGLDPGLILHASFLKLTPSSHRPYGAIYAH